MPLRFSFHKHVLEFNFDARTSRGSMKDRTSWFVKIWNDSDEDTFGLGESAPLAGLSKESLEEVEQELNELAMATNTKAIELPAQPLSLDTLSAFIKNNFNAKYSSNLFALETALLDLMNNGRRVIFEADFVKGKPIPINGLVWMGGLDKMLQQIDIKIKDGFKCIKLKVGGHDFEKECDILQYIRRKYFRDNIVVRLDANGAFKPEDALYKLNLLTRFNIHSIEQPIKPGHASMSELCAKSPIPIALDEELLGVNTIREKQQLLTALKPSYIVIKPSLHGGLCAANDWIKVAEELKIGWWLTSSLESTVGLNALAQLASTYPLALPQGLGTGAIYSNNFPSPLVVRESSLVTDPQLTWDLRHIFPRESLYIDE